MGAKDWFVCYADPGTDVRAVLAARPPLDRPATDDLVRRLFPGRTVEPLDDAVLGEVANPADDEVHVAEDIGDRLPFEEPFWAAAHPATEDDDHPLPFHPLELGEAALHHLFGFVLEGYSGMDGEGLVDPFDVPLAGYRLGELPRERRRGWFRRR